MRDEKSKRIEYARKLASETKKWPKRKLYVTYSQTLIRNKCNDNL